MRVKPFALERFQSEWEHRVRFNLSESGVQPLTVRAAAGRRRRARGPARRAARLHPDQRHAARCASASPRSIPAPRAAHVQVTNGGSEANFVTDLAARAAGRRGGGARAHLHAGGRTGRRLRRHGARVADGARPRGRPLASGPRRARDARRAAHAGASCSARPTTPPARASRPPNSTRWRAAAARHGAWVVSDEIYRGAELDGVAVAVDVGPRRPRGRHERPVEGLRPAGAARGLGRRAAGSRRVALGATTTTRRLPPGALSDQLATAALVARDAARGCSRARSASCARTCRGSRRGWPAAATPSTGSRPKPARSSSRATTLPMNSTALVTRLRDEESVLVVPGDHFGMDGYLRLGAGEHADYVLAGLERSRRSWIAWPQPLRLSASVSASGGTRDRAVADDGQRHRAKARGDERVVGRVVLVHVPAVKGTPACESHAFTSRRPFTPRRVDDHARPHRCAIPQLTRTRRVERIPCRPTIWDLSAASPFSTSRACSRARTARWPWPISARASSSSNIPAAATTRAAGARPSSATRARTSSA